MIGETDYIKHRFESRLPTQNGAGYGKDLMGMPLKALGLVVIKRYKTAGLLSFEF